MEEIVTIDERQFKLTVDRPLTAQERASVIANIRKQSYRTSEQSIIMSGATNQITGFTPTKQTYSGYIKSYPQLQVVGSTIYYVWQEYDNGEYIQIWTATSNLSGSVFTTPIKQTFSDYDKYEPQFQVVGSTIYYVWEEYDTSNRAQIWTATSNLSGSGFTPTKRTTSAYGKYRPQLQVVGLTIYYVWEEDDNSYRQIWTATSNLDGSGFTPTKQTFSGYIKSYPQLQVVGSTIYYVWQEHDVYGQIWTATSNLNGSGITPTKLTYSPYYKYNPQLQVVGSTIYYVWQERDGNNYRQIWTATSNLNGSGFVPTKQTDSIYIKNYPQLQVVDSKIYYVWHEHDGVSRQIWTATSNLSGSGFTPTKQTTSAYNKEHPQLQVVGSTIYYVWEEDDSDYNAQIWTALLPLVPEVPSFPSCILTPKYSGEDVTLQATPKDGIGPYYVEFLKDGDLIDYSRLGYEPNPIDDAPEGVPIIRIYTLDDVDIAGATLGYIRFSVHMEDSCPTGVQMCDEYCDVAIGCVAPVCNFVVT